jgi:hypothetical protein
MQVSMPPPHLAPEEEKTVFGLPRRDVLERADPRCAQPYAVRRSTIFRHPSDVRGPGSIRGGGDDGNNNDGFASDCSNRFGGRGYAGSGGSGDWIGSRLRDTTSDQDVARHRMAPPDPLTYPTLQTRAARNAARKVAKGLPRSSKRNLIYIFYSVMFV